MLNNISHNRVLKNISALAILQAFNYAAPLIVLVYLTNVLGVELYGVVAFSTSIIQISYILLDFGFSLSAIQKISLYREKKKFISVYIGAIFVIKFIFFLIVAGCILYYAFTTEKYIEHRLLLALTLLPIFCQAFQPLWFFLGIERMSYITISMVASKVLFVGIVLITVMSEEDYLWVPIANGASQLVAAALGLFFLYKNGYFISPPTTRYVCYAFKSSLGFFLSRASVSIYSTGGAFALGLMSTPAAVSVYSMSEQLYRVMQSVFVPITQAIHPYMAKEKNYKFLLKVSIACFAVVVVGSLIGYFVSPYLVLYVFGAEWLAILPVLNIFFCVVIVNVIGVISGYPLAAALGKTDVVNRSTIYASVVYILCIIFLWLFGMVEPLYLAVALLLVEVAVLAYRSAKLWPIAYGELGRM